jgi:RhtB (resistance to homoserine/threonine) family protein
MLPQFFSIGIIILLGAMLPGPDFAIVVKNTLLHSRRSGLFTALGIASACLIHITYCSLGLAIVISSSVIVFDIIKYIGAAYLFYLGTIALFSKSSKPPATSGYHKKSNLSDKVSFRQGFLCCLLNPKATIFFLALFTVVINPQTPVWEMLTYAAEMFVIILSWFSSLTIILSYHKIKKLLDKAEKYISKILGIFLIGFGIALIFIRN